MGDCGSFKADSDVNFKPWPWGKRTSQSIKGAGSVMSPPEGFTADTAGVRSHLLNLSDTQSTPAPFLETTNALSPG